MTHYLSMKPCLHWTTDSYKQQKNGVRNQNSQPNGGIEQTSQACETKRSPVDIGRGFAFSFWTISSFGVTHRVV